jgi:hypothetical protein
MAPKLSKRLSEREFASLLTVGNTAVNGPPAMIPAEHSAQLIGLGYMMDLAGRLRLGFENNRRNDHRPLYSTPSFLASGVPIADRIA